ncbi:probable ion channel CASTOR isoform X3 [Prunus dulcis]|uniref:probable ion channel CASTOR isoform X3 n=1 Tax=Prunus dulcis TaxID=3755 RepID=UPI0014833A90|nr:probable ion channel CASTOR isoform X3 [Prunus dulcis]
MSLDSDSAAVSSTSRDWYFPSPPFIHNNSNSTKFPKYPRRFPTNPRQSQHLPPDYRPPFGGVSSPNSSPPFRSVSSSTSAPHRAFNHERLRRRVDFGRRREKPQQNDVNDAIPSVSDGVSRRRSEVSSAVSGDKFLGNGFNVRWKMAFFVAIATTVFSSVVYQNFCLHIQVNELQEHISKLEFTLRAYNLSDSTELISSFGQQSDLHGKSLKRLALMVSLTLLSMPVLAFKYIDYVSRSRSSENISEEVSLNKQLAYRVDLFLSVHPYSKPLALLVATLLLIFLGGLALFGVKDDSLAECLWLSWTYVADSGNHTDSEKIGERLVSVSISFGGMLIFAMMLGLVSDAISEKFDSLRKGRSKVVEQNHTLILGWSDKLGSLLNQLAIANESLGGGIVVVMAERDKEEMELDIAKMEFNFKGTSVICRSGSPLILADLKKVSVSKARAIIILAEDGNADQIWEDILGFENCEFYIKRWSQLDGMHFEDVLISYPDAIPCGIKVASLGGKIILNPDDSYVLQEGDEVLVIAEDDDTYAPAPLPMVWRGSLPKDFIVPKSAERILFCGWRRDMEDMIMVLDAFLAPSSELWMFNEVAEKEREKKLIDGGLDISRLVNITLVNREGNAVIRRHLESLPLQSFDSILILADESVEDSAIQADSRSLATLLLIRDIQAKRLPMVTHVQRGSFSQGSWIGEMQQASDKSVIISEILDPRTKNLLSMSKISDYVLSNELVSMALAMVAEDRQINDVLEELFAEEGNELQIRQADLYLREGEELSFYEVLLRARQRREVMIGYRLADAERAVINPPSKSKRRRWSVKDVFVVIAEKE